MGMTEDFETSLQVLRGFDTDITVEVNEIKVICLVNIHIISSESNSHFVYNEIVQRSVASASTSRRTAIRFADLKRRRYYFPLTVSAIARKSTSGLFTDWSYSEGT